MKYSCDIGTDSEKKKEEKKNYTIKKYDFF